MADAKVEKIERLLRRHLRDFLTKQTQERKPLRTVLSHASEYQGAAYLFGGVARDLLQDGLKAQVRDIDIVIDEGVFPDVQEAMDKYIKRRTRFGGLHLQHKHWLFDIWSLADTWAFRESLVPQRDFSELPKTTFLNVEAIAIELTPNPRRRNVFAHGFFEAFLMHTVEINLEENPYPALCVVRSLLTANRLNFAIGPQLAKYIEHYGAKLDMEELLAVQYSHYGRVMLNKEIMWKWVSAIKEQRSICRSGNVFLPGSYSRQLTFWNFSAESNDLCEERLFPGHNRG